MIYVSESEWLEIRSLIRLRDSITKDQTRQKNRIKSHLCYLGIEIPEEFNRPGSCWNKRFALWLESVKANTQHGKQTLDFLIAQYEALKSQPLEIIRALRVLPRTEEFEKPFELLMSVPGIGKLTGMALQSEIDDIKRFNGADHFAVYIRMIP